MVNATKATLTLATYVATVSIAAGPIDVIASTVALSLTTYAATVTQVGTTSVAATTAALTLTTLPATITLSSSAISEFFGVTLYGVEGDKLTGQTVYLEAFDSSNTRQQYNWVTNSFVSPASHTLALAEVDSINQPGWYGALGDTSVWNDRISLHAWYTSTEDLKIKNYNKVVDYVGGIEITGLTTTQNAALIALPSSAQIASATLSAATTTPIAANVKQVNSVTIQGAGVAGNSMRPV